MIGAQSGLFYWKKQHKRSYELVRRMAKSRCCIVVSIITHTQLHAWFQVTLLGLWLVPVVISVYMIWWKFVLVSQSADKFLKPCLVVQQAM